MTIPFTKSSLTIKVRERERWYPSSENKHWKFVRDSSLMVRHILCEWIKIWLLLCDDITDAIIFLWPSCKRASTSSKIELKHHCVSCTQFLHPFKCYMPDPRKYVFWNNFLFNALTKYVQNLINRNGAKKLSDIIMLCYVPKIKSLKFGVKDQLRGRHWDAQRWRNWEDAEWGSNTISDKYSPNSTEPIL